MNDPLYVNWEAHLYALPVATIILSGAPEHAPDTIWVNQLAREVLGLKDAPLAAGAGRRVHPEDYGRVAYAWLEFEEGSTARFSQTFRWIRPDNGDTQEIAVRFQRLLCGAFQGWVRPAKCDRAVQKLEDLLDGRG